MAILRFVINKHNLLQKRHFILTQTRDGRGIIGPWSTVHNRSSPSISNCIFLHNILHINNAKLIVSSAWWPLNRGENNGRTLDGTAIKWPRPLDRGGSFIVYSFLQIFWDFDFWPLKGDSTVYVSFTVEQYQGPSTLINNEIGEGRGDKMMTRTKANWLLRWNMQYRSADTLFWQMSIYIDIDDVYHPINERQLVLFKSG